MNTDIFWIIKDFLSSTKNLSKREKQLISDTVSMAIRRTATIISQSRKDGRDQPSNILSTTWQSACNELNKIDNKEIKQFAGTLEMKSKYWSDPSKFSDKEINEYGMKLTQVEATLKELTK